MLPQTLLADIVLKEADRSRPRHQTRDENQCAPDAVPVLPQRADHSHRRFRPVVRYGALLGIWGAIGVIWCGILPLIAHRPAIKSRLDELEASGIDASAMYYSELPAMENVLRFLQEFRERHPRDLWVPIWIQSSQTGMSAGDESPARN